MEKLWYYDFYCESESEISDYEDSGLLNDGECLVDDPQGGHEQHTAEEQWMANLADWAATCRIKQIHVTRLQQILNKHLDFLPLDARSMLKIMQTLKTKNDPPGKYYHFGLAAGAKRSLASLDYSIAPK